jgi:hypothetical protein
LLLSDGRGYGRAVWTDEMGVVLLEMGWTVAWLATGGPLFYDVRQRICGWRDESRCWCGGGVVDIVVGFDKDKSVCFRISVVYSLRPQRRLYLYLGAISECNKCLDVIAPARYVSS